MAGHIRAMIQRADRHARNKEYLCLFPGCQKKAIRSHAIPRALCIEALADNGVVFSRRQSLNGAMHMTDPTDPPEVVEIGVNDASTFKGYCSFHDTRLFVSAETNERHKKNGMFIAHHLRAISVEYCRKRQVLDFHKKFLELTSPGAEREDLKNLFKQQEIIFSAFGEVYLGSILNLIGGSDVDSVDYFCIPFSRNIQVSCCGCFDAVPGQFDSMICYNLISHADMSMLVLTNFTVVKHYLDSFVRSYDLPRGTERLVNDIAFAHCEEPLIGARLWRSLHADQKLLVRLSLRHPDVRSFTPTLRVIRLARTDFPTQLTPSLLARLPTKLDQVNLGHHNI